MTTPSLLDLTIVAPALVAGMLVLVTHVPLGMQILRRGIVFIDLALAQIAALGVIIAGLFDFDPQGLGTQLAAGCAALLGAGLLTWTERRWPDVQEAQIGVLFVLAATGGLLLLANNPHGGEHLRDLLAGQILWVRYDQLVVPAIGTALIAALLVTKRAQLHPLLFYVVFALAVTASVQLVGVYLVFASLMVPGLATRRFGRRRLAAAYGVGLAGYAAGLLLSTLVDLPSGAMIVWCMTACAILTFALGPRASPPLTA
jgi:zinc/manganese transport system permease protein